MTSKEFVELFYHEKTDYFKSCFDENAGTLISQKIKELNLSAEQKEALKEIVDGVLTDTYYTILLGGDGSANIGGRQISYKIYDEEENLLTGFGEIGAEAWKFFQNDENDFLSY
ncbi:MAG TPA: hypothetical protein VIL74_17205 [Pyrinomonadaceae bacterium]|jgi:hypothetical protein